MSTRRDGIFGEGSNSSLGFFRAERKAKVGSCGEELEQKCYCLHVKLPGQVAECYIGSGFFLFCALIARFRARGSSDSGFTGLNQL